MRCRLGVQTGRTRLAGGTAVWGWLGGRRCGADWVREAGWKLPGAVDARDIQKPPASETGAVDARDLRKPLASETGTVDARDMRKPPASKTGAVDARDMRKPPVSETGAVDARDMRKPPASETGAVDARDTCGFLAGTFSAVWLKTMFSIETALFVRNDTFAS